MANDENTGPDDIPAGLRRLHAAVEAATPNQEYATLDEVVALAEPRVIPIDAPDTTPHSIAGLVREAWLDYTCLPATTPEDVGGGQGNFQITAADGVEYDLVVRRVN